MKKNYTVIGIYGDNQQPWMAHVEQAGSPKVAAKRAIGIIYEGGQNGVEVEDIFVVDVIEGYANGVLCNDKLLNIDDLKPRKK